MRFIEGPPTLAVEVRSENDYGDAAEREMAAKRADYFAAGKLLAYGPVLVPGAAFGLGILEVENEAEARQFGDNDPSVLAGLNRFEIHPMRLVASRAKG